MSELDRCKCTGSKYKGSSWVACGCKCKGCKDGDWCTVYTRNRKCGRCS